VDPIIARLTRRYISRRLFQSVLFVLGVALGVAVSVAIDLANGSASRAFNLSTESIAGRATHQIVGGPGGLPSELYRQVRVDLGIRTSAPIIDAHVQAVTLGEQPIRVLGVDPFAEAPFRSYLTTTDAEEENRVAFDALTAFIVEPGSVLISETLAGRFGVEAGDTLILQPKTERAEARLVGLLQPSDGLSEQALENLMLTDIATAQELFGTPGRITRIDLILPPDYDTSRIEAILPPGARLTTPDETNDTLNQITAAFELNLQALSLLALIVGVFLIYNTVTFSVVQRRPVIGVMRSLGATRRQIFVLILSEAFLLGFVGTALGLGLGILFGRGAVRLVTQTITDIYFRVNVEGVTVQPFSLLKGAAIGILASVFAAIPPSFEATRTPPAGTLRRSEIEQKAFQVVPYATAGAVLLNVAGVLMLQLPTRSIVISFAALFAILNGLAMLTPLVMIGFMRAVTPLTGHLFGVVGRMAPRAITRSLSRTSVAVAALTLSVSVIVGVSVMIGSFRNTVTDWLDTTLGADIYISPPSITATSVSADLDPAIVETLLAVDGVANAETVRTVNVSAPDYPDLPPVNLAVTSDDIAFERRFVWNEAPGGDYRVALRDGDVLVTESFAFRRGITRQNNTLTLLTDQGPQTFTIAGVYYDYTTDQGRVLMADDVYRDYYDDPFISSLALYVEPDADLDTVIDTLRTETLGGRDLQVRGFRALRENALEVFDRAFSITVALQGLATLVAFIGILSALMALQLEHSREVGVMRANGMTPRQLWGFTLVQTGLMGTTAGLLSVPLGMVLAMVLIFVINVRSFGWTMQLTAAPGDFAGAFAVALVASLAAGLYPAWRLGRLVMAQALRSE
jgi:putative ABC transport system permease protein